MTLTDENAFGLLILLYDITDLEYGAEPTDFADAFTRFRELVFTRASEEPLGAGALAIELGHAVYFEIGDGDHAADPIGWLKALCLPVIRAGFEVSAILTHGGRWLDSAEPLPRIDETPGGYRWLRAARPSEPLQRALHASAHCNTSDGTNAWGAGLYVDTEAVEALGKVLKNAPTPLEAAGATFYRLSLPR